MPSRWTLQGSRQEAKIEDLLQEVARLKLRMSRMERRKDLSPLPQDIASIRPQGKSIPLASYRSSVQTECLGTNDGEGILDDQFSFFGNDMFEGPSRQSSTLPLSEFSFEEFEDSLPKSSSLPLYDEPVFEIFDLDHPAHVDDERKKDAQSELFMHIVPDKTMNVLVITDMGNALQNTFDVIKIFKKTLGNATSFIELNALRKLLYDDGHKPEGGDLKDVSDCTCRSVEDSSNFEADIIELKTDCLEYPDYDASFAGNLNNQDVGPCSKSFIHPFILKRLRELQNLWCVLHKQRSIKTSYNERSKISRQFDTGWTYPDRFSQPNLPP
ncbi:hypothetical protein M5K25_001757 [Dendrobium thyrsiflorum]|uniref:Uncharacterized protein n=1 Tax=Dendrobium thyrsiflorum TaxID=117978 RepID=A0ABD0VRA0_DENTH